MEYRFTIPELTQRAQYFDSVADEREGIKRPPLTPLRLWSRVEKTSS
jgi:hypothetical protein